MNATLTAGRATVCVIVGAASGIVGIPLSRAAEAGASGNPKNMIRRGPSGGVLYPGGGHDGPDCVSADTSYSTSVALADVDRDDWFHLVVGNGNDQRRERLAVYYHSGDGTFPRTPDW